MRGRLIYWCVVVAAVFCAAPLAKAVPPPGPDEAPRVDKAESLAFLDQWTGTWRGRFTVFSHSGRLVTELDVQQRYWWDGEVQRAEFHETVVGTGVVTTAEARNYVDEHGRLVCEVDKSNGESSRHFGRVVDGELFWFAKEDGRVETFRESVRVDEDGARSYVIDGFGRYGEGVGASYFVFAGVYQGVE